MYSASVPVATQLANDRGKGFDDALLRVLIKVSGDARRVEQGNIVSSWLPAEQYVQTFSYRENPVYALYIKAQQEKDQLSIEADEPDTGQLESPENEEDFPEGLALIRSTGTKESAPLPYLLEVSFASSLVQERMTELGIPVWGSTRPSVLVWIVVEKAGERYIIGAADKHEIIAAILTEGEARGVPLFLPVADLQDVSNVDVDDLWGLYSDAVGVASERYPYDAIVMARVYESGEGLWSGNWTLKQKQVLQSGSFYDADLESFSEAVVSHIALIMSSQYAILKRPGEAGNVIDVEVAGIVTFEDYIGLQRYLKMLPPVVSAQLQWISNERTAYRIVLRGTGEQFMEHLELGDRMKPDTERSSAIVKESMERSSLAPFINYFIWSDSH